MLTELGLVERVERDKAIILISRGGHCEACTEKGTCGMGTAKEYRIEIKNNLGLKGGERVEVSLPTGSVLWLVFLVYLIPVLLMLTGAGLGYLLAGDFGMDQTKASILLALLGLLLPFIPLRILDKRARNSPKYSPQITKVMPPSCNI